MYWRLLGTAVAAASLSLGGCSSWGGSDTPETAASFQGSWGPAFQQAYDSASSDLGKSVLKDGVIDDSEIAEVKQAYISCLESLGCTVHEVNNDGSSSIVPPQHVGDSVEDIQTRVRELEGQCDAATDWSGISYLYSGVSRNPDNADNSVLISECLIRVGLAPEGYSPDEYLGDLASGTFTDYLENQDTPEGQKFKACNLDPLHTQP